MARTVYDVSPVTGRVSASLRLDREESTSPVPSGLVDHDVCTKHEWRPKPKFPGAPKPPMSLCPGCRAALEQKSEPGGPPVYIGGYPRPNPPIPELAERLWKSKREALRAEGVVLVGTIEEH